MASNRNIAVVGCGYWGKNLVRNLAELGVLAMVCDPEPAQRLRAVKIAGQVETVADVAEVFEGPVAGVVLATPAETHYDLARRALQAGKDVFVEKPLALTHADGIRLVKLAAERERILMVGHVLEYHPAVIRLIELVRSGELGEVRYLYSNRLSLGKVRREENILWSFAPHDIAVILRLTGRMPTQVAATGSTFLQPGVADVTVTNLLFDGGVRAHVFVSWLHPFKEQRLVVVGSRKMASFDDVARKLVVYDQRVEISKGEPIPIRGPGEDVPFAPDEPLLLECRAFVKAIASRRPPLADGHSGVRVLEVLQGAQHSLANGGEPVTLSEPAAVHSA